MTSLVKRGPTNCQRNKSHCGEIRDTQTRQFRIAFVRDLGKAFGRKMKSLIALVSCISLSFAACSQGIIDFRNSSSSLISANGAPMPVSGTQEFIFAIFLAPQPRLAEPALRRPIPIRYGRTSADTTPIILSHPVELITASVWMSVTPAGYPAPGTVVDFLIRGWSANAGATWPEALANWNNGSPLVPMFIGSSTIGDDIMLTSIATATPLGLGPHVSAGL